MAVANSGISIPLQKILFLILLCISLNLSTVESKYVKGTINSKEDWEFIARFCFLSEKGSLKFKFSYPADYGVQNILLYFDDDAQWPAVYKSSKTCLEKEMALLRRNNQLLELTIFNEYVGCYLHNTSKGAFYTCDARRTLVSSRDRWWFVVVSNCLGTKNCWQREAVLDPDNNQVIELSTASQWSGCVLKEPTAASNQSMYECQGGRTFRSYRERWWFIAVSNCAGTEGVALDYELWMTNGQEEDIFSYQFSADEFYIIEVDIAFLCVFAFILVMSVYVASALQQRQLFHTTYKMYMMSLIFECLHLFLMCVGYGVFANTGDQAALDRFKIVGRICESISILTFLLMLILMAKGYTITRGRLSQSGTIKISVFITIYVIVYAVLFIYEAVFFDPGLVLYIYESPAGYGLLALRIMGWIWFCYAIFFTLKHYPEKNKFYYPFFFFYTLWFWAGPIIILVSMHAIPLWIRQKTVNGVEICVSFIGHIGFLVLTRPSAANTNFPYHVRTTQIGVMNTAPDAIPMTANPNVDSFTAHSYAPSKPPPYSETEYDDAQPQQRFSDIFTVSQTRSAGSTRNGTGSNGVNLDKFPHAAEPNGYQQSPA